MPKSPSFTTAGKFGLSEAVKKSNLVKKAPKFIK